jgi:hypothetical protein
MGILLIAFMWALVGIQVWLNIQSDWSLFFVVNLMITTGMAIYVTLKVVYASS